MFQREVNINIVFQGRLHLKNRYIIKKNKTWRIEEFYEKLRSGVFQGMDQNF